MLFGSQLPEEAAKELGHANLMYASGRYKEAVEMLMHVIKVRHSMSAQSTTNPTFECYGACICWHMHLGKGSTLMHLGTHTPSCMHAEFACSPSRHLILRVLLASNPIK